MDIEITFDGNKIFHVDKDGSLGERAGTIQPRYPSLDVFLGDWQSPRRYDAANSGNGRSGTRRDTSHGIGLEIPNYSLPPPVCLNELYWPQGASRWAVGYFAINYDAVIATSSFSPKKLKIVQGAATIVDATMYVLRVQPVTPVRSGLKTDAPRNLGLMILVDRRYFWQFKNLGDYYTGDTTVGESKPSVTWSAVYTQLGTQLGVTIVDEAVDADYLKPDVVELSRRYDNAGIVLDAVAHSVGQRITVNPATDAVEAIGWATSKTRLATNTSNTNQKNNEIAGDDLHARDRHFPEKVRVNYPKANVVADTENEYYSITKNVTNDIANAIVTGMEKTIFSTAYADHHELTATPDNDTELQDLATQIAADYSDQIAKSFDRTYSLLAQWVPTGYDDFVLYGVGVNSPNEQIEATTKPSPGQAMTQQNRITTLIERKVQRLIYTRAISAPHNFGVEQMLHASEPERVPVQPLRFQVINTGGNDLVPPTSSAVNAHIVDGSPTTGTWGSDPAYNVSIKDESDHACVLRGEFIVGAFAPDSRKFEALGEQGLVRRASVIEALGINHGATGTVEIYQGGSLSGVEVEAKNLDEDASVSDEVVIVYVPDQDLWWIVAVEGVGASATVEATRFSLRDDLDDGTASAHQLNNDGTDTGTDITVWDRATLFKQAKGVAGDLTGDDGWAVKVNGEWTVFECQSMAGQLRGRPTDDLNDGSATIPQANIDDFYGTQQDYIDPGTSYLIKDDGAFFPRTRSGHDTMSILDALGGEYHVFQATSDAGFISADLASASTVQTPLLYHWGTQQDYEDPIAGGGSALITNSAGWVLKTNKTIIATLDAIGNAYEVISTNYLFDISSDANFAADLTVDQGDVVSWVSGDNQSANRGIKTRIDNEDEVIIYHDHLPYFKYECSSQKFVKAIETEYGHVVAIECDDVMTSFFIKGEDSAATQQVDHGETITFEAKVLPSEEGNYFTAVAIALDTIRFTWDWTKVQGWTSSGAANQFLMNIGGTVQWVDGDDC